MKFWCPQHPLPQFVSHLPRNILIIITKGAASAATSSLNVSLTTRVMSCTVHGKGEDASDTASVDSSDEIFFIISLLESNHCDIMRNGRRRRRPNPGSKCFYYSDHLLISVCYWRQERKERDVANKWQLRKKKGAKMEMNHCKNVLLFFENRIRQEFLHVL